MSLHEIVLPETKPETEWILGRAVRKVSPTYSHARLPTVAFEVLSTDDEPRRIHHKIATYLAAGAAVVIVCPDRAVLEVHDKRGRRILRAGDVFAHVALPGFSLDVAQLFERARR